MRFVFVPDSFKGSLSSRKLIEILTAAAREHYPEAEIFGLPLADGGEGTVEALAWARKLPLLTQQVHGPLGENITAHYAKTADGVCLLEMAQACGLPMVPESKRNPAKVSTLGCGEQLMQLLQAGERRFAMGIGGSASHDCGMGFLSALGGRFYDASGAPLPPLGENLGKVARMELPRMDAEISVICDVTNPLCGPTGSAAVYAPQKGATTSQVAELDEASLHFGRLLEATSGKEIVDVPGAGAAGGMGAALLSIGARLRGGVDMVLDLLNFQEIARNADLVVTGEGRVDTQSIAYGKAVGGVAKRCRALGVPVAVLAGSLAVDAVTLEKAGCGAALPLVSGPCELDYAMEHAPELALDAARRLFSLFAMGGKK